MGIYFGSHTASDDRLDDYEEGTWSPNWHSNGSSAAATTYAGNHGTYVKIGDMVHLCMYSTQTNNGNNGPWQSFAPFANRNHDGARSWGSVMTNNMDSGSSATFWGIYLDKNTDRMYLYYVTKNQGWTYQESGHDGSFGLIGNITYESV